MPKPLTSCITSTIAWLRDRIRWWTRPSTRPILGYLLDRLRSPEDLVRENALLRKQLEVAMFDRRHRNSSFVVVAVCLVGAHAAHAALTAEQQCQKGRYEAAARYAHCEQKAAGLSASGGDAGALKSQEAFSKCGLTYAESWAKLQAKATRSGSTCDNPRYDSSVSGTVTDRLTGLLRPGGRRR